MIRAVLLAATTFVAAPGAAASQASPSDAFRPDTVVAAPGGPRIVMLRPSTGGVAAMRLSVRFEEGPTEAGAGWILRDLAQAHLESLARPVGARVAVSRTPWGLAYTVEGAVADIEFLTYLLREGAGTPQLGSIPFESARQASEAVLASRTEAPGPRVLDLLRRRVAPELLSDRGTPVTLQAMGPARVREVWIRTHQPEAMTLVVAADVPPEVILAGTRGMGAPPTTLTGPPQVPTPAEPSAPRVQTLRGWYGEAWWGGSPADPIGPVAALLVAETVESAADGFEAGVELWELRDRWALAVVGAAYSSGQHALRTTVSGAVGATLTGLSDARVDRAVARVRRDVLMAARTPGGRVAAVGRVFDAAGRPDAAVDYVDALHRLDRADVERFLRDMAAGGSVQAEVRP